MIQGESDYHRNCPRYVSGSAAAKKIYRVTGWDARVPLYKHLVEEMSSLLLPQAYDIIAQGKPISLTSQDIIRRIFRVCPEIHFRDIFSLGVSASQSLQTGEME